MGKDIARLASPDFLICTMSNTPNSQHPPITLEERVSALHRLSPSFPKEHRSDLELELEDLTRDIKTNPLAAAPKLKRLAAITMMARMTTAEPTALDEFAEQLIALGTALSA